MVGADDWGSGSVARADPGRACSPWRAQITREGETFLIQFIYRALAPPFGGKVGAPQRARPTGFRGSPPTGFPATCLRYVRTMLASAHDKLGPYIVRSEFRFPYPEIITAPDRGGIPHNLERHVHSKGR